MNKETLEKANNFPLPHPPPARARPFTSLRWRSGRAAGQLAAPRPARGGLEKQNNAAR